MRALTALACAALLLAGCETAFVGRAPSGLYALAEVDGRALPAERRASGSCRLLVESGHFDLDSLARRYEIVLRERDSCSSSGVREVREAGSYLRRSGRLALEADRGAGGRIATESGSSISLSYDGSRLLFRQSRPERR